MKFRGERTAVANDRMSLMSDRDDFDDLTEIGNSQYGKNDPNIRDEEEVKPTKTSYAVDDEEYQPTYEPEPTTAPTTATQNPYDQQEHPVGFGAERQNLMQEEQISMPAMSDNPYDQVVEQ